MNAIRLARRLRPVSWAFAVLGLVAIVAWRAAVWNPPSGSAEDAGGNRLAATDTVQPGVATYDADGRVPAPKLEGTTLDGDTFNLSELRGKIVVINVWGSWCGPCRAETPDLVRLAREDAGRGVRFVGINTRDNPAAARSFVRQFEVPYPSLDDTDGQALLGFRQVIPTAVIPSTVLIDRQGEVAARIIGPVTYRTLSGLLDDEIARAGGFR